MPILGNFVF